MFGGIDDFLNHAVGALLASIAHMGRLQQLLALYWNIARAIVTAFDPPFPAHFAENFTLGIAEVAHMASQTIRAGDARTVRDIYSLCVSGNLSGDCSWVFIDYPGYFRIGLALL